MSIFKTIIYSKLWMLFCLGTALAADVTKKSNLDIQTWSTPNGATIYFVPIHELPILDIGVVFDAGSDRDALQYGLSTFTSNMLDEGTNTLDTEQIAEGFTNVGAIYAKQVSRDNAAVQLRTLTDPAFLKPAVDNFTQVLNYPNFPAKSFARVQKQILNTIKQQQQSPPTIAFKTFYQALYNGYPYGHPLAGDTDTISALTTDDLKKFYQTYYVGSNAIMAIVGDIDRAQAEAIAHQVVGQLPKGNKPPALPNPSPNLQAIEKQVTYPASQTNVLIGSLGIAQDSSHYFPVMVGDHILGGGALTSRLFKEIRDNKGYTYNISSHAIPLKNKGPYLISFTSRNEATQDAIKLSKDMMASFIQKGPTEVELSRAKEFLVGSFPLHIDSNSAITGNIANIGFYQLPLNYLDTYQDNIKAVNKEQVMTAFKDMINPQKLVVVTVGPNLDENKPK